jgi:23S rRNA (pseudouridine1915-N3)-methyltransferase
LCEVEEKRPLPVLERKVQEAKLLLAAIPDKAKIIALDERGTSLTSVQLAKKIETWRDEGFADMAFLIGGADGHDPSIRDKADLILNLGTLTWPHMLVRVLIAEQLWRAHSILSGHPYHRE